MGGFLVRETSCIHSSNERNLMTRWLRKMLSTILFHSSNAQAVKTEGVGQTPLLALFLRQDLTHVKRTFE